MDTAKFVEAQERAKTADEYVREYLPELVRARADYAKNPSAETEVKLDLAQAEAARRLEAVTLALDDMEAVLGISRHDEIAAEPLLPTDHIQMPRRKLTASLVETTGDINAGLADAVDAIRLLLPKGWLEIEPRDSSRLATLRNDDGFLSITKGMRPQSEDVGIHKLRQALYLADDYLKGHPDYDHFAGATILPQLAQFAFQHDHIKAVGGYSEKLRDLWSAGSASVQSTLMELFTASRCASLGRSVAFIPTSNEKTPDIRCHDPYPSVIECKLQDTFTKFELAEEQIMSEIFALLRMQTKKLGLYGVFKLELNMAARGIDRNEVVAKLVGQRFLPDPSKVQVHSWGTTALDELPNRIGLPSATRPYSPQLLEYIFDWKSDLPEVDGLCCQIGNARQAFIDEVTWPMGLLWTNVSEEAVKKKTWAPINLFAKAQDQIPPGEFGMVYVAYVEGARPEIADARVAAFQTALKEWDHSAKIRIPISVLCRLHPFSLDEGKPDLIESNLRYCSDTYGTPELFDFFPTNIFTN